MLRTISVFAPFSLAKPIFTAALLMAGAMITIAPARAEDKPSTCREIVLYNGRIVTMDARNTIACSVAIAGGRISAVSSAHRIPPHDACAKVINLRGRTVVPGLIDSHSHFLALGLRPGHDTRFETAASISGVQQALRAQAMTVKAGEWITSIGGWDPNQLVERRLPTLAELDSAAPDHPVFLFVGLGGPAATNTLGKAFFQGKGVQVGAEGAIAGGGFGGGAPNQSIAALSALRAIQTFEDQKRGTLEAMKYAASLGLTTHDEEGGGWPPVSYEPGKFGEKPPWDGLVQVTNGTANSLDPFSGYNPILALHREGKMLVRMRLFFYSTDLRPDLPFLAQRLNNAFDDFGDDWIKVSGVGEYIAGGNLTSPPANYEAAVRLVAQRGWSYQQHAGSPEEERSIIGVWEKVNATTPIAGLRWCLDHVPGIDDGMVNRLKAMGAGATIWGARYLSGTPTQEGSPFKLLVDSGIHVGYGGDGANVAPLDPWLHIYYMVTGKNSAGVEIEPGQTISRMQALRLYTREGGWFTRDEDKLGSIEVGKLGDLAVLSDDFLDTARVPDEAIKRISSVLTVVDGTIVYDNGTLGN